LLLVAAGGYLLYRMLTPASSGLTSSIVSVPTNPILQPAGVVSVTS